MLRYVWLFATPWPVAHQSPLSMEFLRQEYWCGVPFPTPGDLPNPGIVKPRLSSLLHWQADSLPLVPPGRISTKQSLLQKSSSLACQSITTAKEETSGEASEGRMALGTILCGMQVTLQLRGWASAGFVPRKAMAFRSSGSSHPSEAQHFTTHRTDSGAQGIWCSRVNSSPLALIPRSWELLGPGQNGRHWQEITKDLLLPKKMHIRWWGLWGSGDYVRARGLGPDFPCSVGSGKCDHRGECVTPETRFWRDRRRTSSREC